ncbi:MAG: response regulator transcription factor [Gammaproteobacteria bacterium]|nr:MAG: response regulator transcription factor [Gammaproteobacteria bacterium]TLZ48053.1 MAG: response regulator transcription factor [Gammaproteobacteria bacterium]
MTLTGAPGAGDGGSEPRPYRIILVDPQRLFRQALRALLDAQAGFSVVGETGSAAEALELAGALKPDVVVTELHLADGSQAGENSGSALIGTLHSRLPEVAILVLTSARARDVAAAVRRAGARGYLLKEHGREELLRALREVTAGRWYRSITPEACPRTAARDDRYLNNRAAYLTQRQRQVLRSVALGYRTREIAQMLGVSVRAVHRLRERLRLALRLNSTAELTRFAVRAGFTEGAAEPAR